MQIGRTTTLALVIAAAGPIAAQDFNIDVGRGGSTPPPPGYAAAGQAGVWNSVTAEHVAPFTPGPTAQDVLLVDVNGTQTSVGFHQFGGMDLVSTSDPTVTGDDATLLGDYLATHSALEDCMYLNGLEDGTYEVLTYAWMPNHPGTDQVVRFDFHPGSTAVGGAWGGAHAEGVTYSRDIVEVEDGFLGFHVGLAPGAPAHPGAAFNGFQVRKLGPTPVPLGGRPFLLALALGLLCAGALLRRRTKPSAS